MNPVSLPARLTLLVLAACEALSPAPRNVFVDGKSFVSRTTNESVLLTGANVVMKASPWLPPVTGDTLCLDHWYSNYTCYAFTHRDAAHITGDMGWNFVRLGVVWAGAQPTNEPRLDPEWVDRLHALLDLAASNGIHVLLDVHQDDVGTATCGEGVPQWFSALATPDRIGKPIRPLPLAGGEFPHQPDGLCGTNDTETWALHAGSEEYAIMNPCCVRFNGGGSSWARMEFTWEAQETVHYLFRNKVGRSYYSRYIGLLAAAVKHYPAAFGIELMNEPPSIERDAMYATWQACYDAAQVELPGLAIGVMDTGEAPLGIGGLGLWPSQIKWLKEAKHLFYAFHWYGPPVKDPKKAIENVKWFMDSWEMPALMTEFDSCDVKVPATTNGIGWSYWEYSGFCDRPVRPGDPKKICPAGGCNFGACITGTNGNSWKNLTC